MGRNRFVQPESVRLPLSDGDWIEVKKRLTVGESRRAIAALSAGTRPDGGIALNLEMVGKAELLAYIVDWSLRDASDKPVPFSVSALDNLDPDSYAEIERAVTLHKEAMEADRDAQKKSMAGEIVSAATSPSAV